LAVPDDRRPGNITYQMNVPAPVFVVRFTPS
jgi:hypothetical protein